MIKVLILLMLPLSLFATEIPPTPFPVFLKQGYSSVLEFEDTPTKVVLGDSTYFQVEKLKTSLVIRALDAYASSNMFVYFKKLKPKLFILTASEDSEPTYYKKFEEIKPPPKPTKVISNKVRYKRSTRLLKSEFDDKKDYLLLEIRMTADATKPITPKWDLVRLSHNKRVLKPIDSWAERKMVQKDSSVKARFVFAKPNVPRNLKGVSLVIPLKGHKNAVKLDMPVRPR